MREDTTLRGSKNGKEMENTVESGISPNPNPRANENVKESTEANDNHDVGSEITDGEDG